MANKRTWLREKRLKAGYTQERLAIAVNTCLSEIAKIESGARTPKGPLAIRISKLLNFDIEKFYE